MMSTKYTEMSTSVDQLACFALNFCVLIVKKNLQFKGPFNVSGCGSAIVAQTKQ